VRGERIVYIVDDDAGVRRALERLLRAAGLTPVAFKTAFAFLDVSQTLPFGCLLLDVRMPGMDGLQLQARLNELGPFLPVVVMTGEGGVADAVRAMKAGAIDFIEKPFEDVSLLAAIEAALERGTAPDRDRASVVAARRLAQLSTREREVLDALVAGCPNKVIAADLGISIRTVEVHRARMLQRLGTPRLADAIRLAVIASLAKPPGDGAGQAE
jgi:two-component system, LuxR family, response regulator FixJ